MRRYWTVLGTAILVLVASVLLSGCASSRSVLYSGVSIGSGPAHVISDAAANDDVQVQLARWVAETADRGRGDPNQHFANLPAREFRQRLSAASTRYHFTVGRVEFFHPHEIAPLVILKTNRYLALARAIPAIERSLNPHSGGNDSTGWAFEGFFLEAQDERGVPFIAASDAMRGPNGWGGQWARSNRLYPFPHG